MNILVVEDGFEYMELLNRFLGERFQFTRVGNGQEALDAMSRAAWSVVLLDLCFDRIDVAELLGDWSSLAERFNGSVEQSQEYIARNQGLYILAALRKSDVSTPVLLSHDFSRDGPRWARLEAQYKPVRFVSDNAGPEDIANTFLEMG